MWYDSWQFPLECWVRGYETEESFHGREGAIPADGLFFPFRFRSMAWWEFLALRWRGQIGIQEFLQSRARISDRSGPGAGERDGGVCTNCPDLGVAGALHGRHSREVAEQGPAAELAPCTRTCNALIAVSARETLRDIPASLPAQGRADSCFR